MKDFELARDLFVEGVACYEKKQFDLAEVKFSESLKLVPDRISTMTNLSATLIKLKEFEAAKALCLRTISIDSKSVDAWNYLGLIDHEQSNRIDAIKKFDMALSIDQNDVAVLNNKGSTLIVLGHSDAALACFNKAIAITPDFAEAYFNRGNALQELNRSDEALDSYDHAIKLKPDFSEAYAILGTALLNLKQPQKALAALQSALETGGDSNEIKFYMAALGAETLPAVAPEQFVTRLFDDYADRFDRHLIDTLRYQIPALLFEQVSRYAPAGNLDVLDLGCGTGLFGSLVRPLARTLTGVDLSSGMLKKARQRQVYDELICDELTVFLQSQTRKYDIAVATDVFIYIGDLSTTFRGVAAALRKGGLFGFSVESIESEDCVLLPSLRYAHSRAYLQRLATIHEFELESIEPKVIRQEGGKDVGGFLAIMRRN